MISQLVQAEQGPINQLKASKSVWSAKNDAYTQIQTDLTDLQTKLNTLRDTSTLKQFTVQSSNDQAATVTASAGATEGSHEVIINRLATSERSVHAGVADPTTLVGQGAFSYTYNGTVRTLNTTSTTTLQGLADLITQDSSNPGVSASVLQYDSGDGNAYHLVLQGNDSGSNYSIAINDDQTTLNGANGTVDFTNASFLETQSAQNSQLRVDNYPSDGWIERSSNTVNDVLPGVTLTLHQAASIQVTVARDTTDLKQRITDLVTSYNNIMSYDKSQTAYDADTKVGGLLQGDITVNVINDGLRQVFMGTAKGFQNGTDPFTLAGDIGLSVDKDGMLALDSTKLDDALSTNYKGVLNLIGANGNGTSDSTYMSFNESGNNTKAGSYDVKATFDAQGQLTSAMIKLSSEDNSAWRAANIEGNQIVGATGTSEEGMTLTAAWDGSSTTQTATVRVQDGIANTMYESVGTMLDATTGTITIAEGRAKDAMTMLDTNIASEQKRLDNYEAYLKTKFAKLEASLTILKGQQTSLSSLTAKSDS